jgi:hypothetical protein
MAASTPHRKLADRGVPITFWIPAGEAARLEREARREALTRSKYIARLVRGAMPPPSTEEQPAA